MVTITDGKNLAVVSRGAYENFFATNGWKISCGEDISFSEQSSSENEISCPEKKDENNVVGEMKSDTDGISIPISEMKAKELRELAKEYGIDLAGARKTSEIREKIEAVLED